MNLFNDIKSGPTITNSPIPGTPSSEATRQKSPCRQQILVGGVEVVAWEQVQARVMVENVRLWSTSRTCGVYFAMNGTAYDLLCRPPLESYRVFYGYIHRTCGNQY